MPHAFYILFVFLLGSCVGSFLNVVVWRLPRVEMPEGENLLRSIVRSFQALSYPPSHCPKCEKPLKWYDNVPIFGWIKLGGKCRFCRNPISPRYPIVEAATAGLFVLCYVMLYIVGVGPTPPQPIGFFVDARPVGIYIPPEWPMFLLYLVFISCLLAASLIDAELFLIPLEIPWTMAIVGIVVHTIFDHPLKAGSVSAVTEHGDPSPTAALAAGGFVGLVIAMALYWTGRLKLAFQETGEPLLEVDREAIEEDVKSGKLKKEELENLPPDYTKNQIRWEMRKEMTFLLFPMGGAVAWYVLTNRLPGLHTWWESAVRIHWVSGLLGSLFGAMIGAFTVWITRILGTLGFGRVAMGLGDVDLMFGVGAVLGAGPAVVAFFVAPFFGIVMALYKLFSGSKRELPYGPYLSMASAAMLIFYSRVYETWLREGLMGLSSLFSQQPPM